MQDMPATIVIVVGKQNTLKGMARVDTHKDDEVSPMDVVRQSWSCRPNLTNIQDN